MDWRTLPLSGRKALLPEGFWARAEFYRLSEEVTQKQGRRWGISL